MSEQRYPRRFVDANDGRAWGGYIEQVDPAAVFEYIEDPSKPNERVSKRVYDERIVNGFVADRLWREVFDHHDQETTQIKAKLEKRRANEFFKHLIREQRAEMNKLREELVREKLKSLSLEIKLAEAQSHG